MSREYIYEYTLECPYCTIEHSREIEFDAFTKDRISICTSCGKKYVVFFELKFGFSVHEISAEKQVY